MRTTNSFLSKPVSALKVILTATFLFWLTGCTASANSGGSSGQQDQLVVSGQGNVSVVPDTMKFSLWIEAEGQQLSPMKTRVDQVTATLLRQLQEREIAREDIRSFQLAIHPNYKRENDRTVQDGFLISRQMDVTLRNPDNFDHLIDYALAQGVTRVGSIQYQLNDATEASQRALINAIDNAHAKAALMAEHSGRELGEIISIQESQSSGYPVMRMAAESMSMDVSEPGQQSISARVEVTFRLR